MTAAPSFLTRRDLPAAVVLLSGLAVMGVSLETRAHIALLLPFAAAVALHPWLHDRVRPRLDTMGYLVMSLPFAFLNEAWPPKGQGFGDLILSYNLFFYLCLYVYGTALLKLYAPPDARRLPRLLLAGSLPFVMAGGEVLYEWQYVAVLVPYALALVFLLRAQLRLRYSTGRRRTAGVVGIVFSLAVSGAMTWGAVALIDHYYSDLSRLFWRLSRTVELRSSPGFSDQARLGSISELRDDTEARKVALRVFGSTAPGYLRGRVFYKYGEGQWISFEGKENVRAERGGAQGKRLGRIVLPEREAPLEAERPDFDIYPVARYGAHYFLPLHTTAVDTSADTAELHGGGILKSRYHSTAGGYQTFVDATAPVRTEAERPACRFVPAGRAFRADLASVVSQLALAPGEERVTEKVAAVRGWFLKRYTYRIGIDFDKDRDPLSQFLTEKRHGHCELFASAGTLLLRTLGVPARYVTGFVCEEKLDWGDCFVARNKHAHAWVEYYHPDRGWRVAEFTPPAGLPAVEDEDAGFGEYLRALWAWLKGLGLKGIFELLLGWVGLAGRWLIGAWWRAAVLAVLIGGYLAGRFWRRRRRRRRSVVVRTLPRDLAARREQVLQLERRLARLGFARGEAETLSEYAGRLAEAPIPDRAATVSFLQQYVLQRYAPF